MKIAESLLNAIISGCQPFPPETGGIMGGHDELITDVIFDTYPGLSEQATYSPNVVYLNDCIVRWRNQGIEFRGIFHSHPVNQYSLSGADREYITNIMSAMPTNIEELYFPIIVPTKTMFVYRAMRLKSKILIVSDCLQKV